MNIAYIDSNDFSFFSGAQKEFDLLIKQLKSDHSAESEHGKIESFINKKGHEIMRQVLQGWLDLKADKEKKKDSVITGSGELLNHVQVTTSRALESLFGKVNVTRIGYSQINNTSLFPVDAELNLATDHYSDSLYHRVSNEAIRGSFDNVVETVSTTTGANIPKKQSLNIVKNVARDFEAFYQKKRFIKPEKTSDLLVLTFD